MVVLDRIGSDPEFVVFKNGKLFSSQELNLPGSKKKVYQLENGTMCRDNALIEAQINPSLTFQEFIENIRDTVQEIEKTFNIELKPIPSYVYNDQQINHEECFKSGCVFDTDAYTMKRNPIVKFVDNRRFGGGHIHVSYNNPNKWTSSEIVKWLDLILGTQAVVLDEDETRKKIYGTPGRFRGKEYGLEYRSLSNFWLSNDDLVKWIWNGVELAISAINKYENIENLLKKDSYLVPKCMINNDKEISTYLKQWIEKI